MVEMQVSADGDEEHLWFQHMGGRGRQISKFEVSQVYRATSRTVKDTQRSPISKQQQQQQQNKAKTEQNTVVRYLWIQALSKLACK